MRTPADVDDSVQKQQSGTLIFVLRVESHNSTDAVGSRSRRGGGNTDGAAKRFGAAGHIERVKALDVGAALETLAHYMQWVRRVVDDVRYADTDFWIDVV